MSVAVNLHGVNSDVIQRTADFTLLPSNQATPIISSQPSSNVTQTTWIRAVENQQIIYQRAKPSDGVYRAVEGTELLWTVFAADPSNLATPTSDSTLKFVWRRDGTPLVEVNNSNQYRGSRSIVIQASASNAAATGTYVCEVSNNYGVTETQDLRLEIVALDQYPKLYSNLLINGSADSQLDGWTVDYDILTRGFASTALLGTGFGSMPKLYEILSLQEGKRYNAGVEFTFSQHVAETTRRAFQQWVNLGPDWRSIQPDWMQEKPDGGINEPLAGWRRWVLTGITPQIIDNEADGDNEPFGGFFPAMKYIDQYNSNFVDGDSPVIGLLAESKDRQLNYFTRDKLKFVKYGGKATSQMSQDVDLTDLADFIDGNVLGVRHTSSQFFAYVGAGLTRYKIRAQVAGQGEVSSRVFNWHVADYQLFMERLEQDSVAGRIALMPNTAIEILPLTEDITQVEISYNDAAGRQLSKDLIDGPMEKDVFAIKDCTFLPASLYPIFEYFVTNNNPIKIFGQTYTTTQALQPLFEDASPYQTDYGAASDGSLPLDRFAAWGGDVSKLDRLLDVQAKFALTKLDWTRFGRLTPHSPNIQTNRQNRAIKDFGAAAMFGVEKTRIIPRGTRSARITVRFTHTSNTIADNDPKIKQWHEQTIYYDIWGQGLGSSKQYIDYSYPRCGITQMKFLVVPNNFTPSTKFASYKLPPSSNTVVGYRRQLLSQDVHNSANLELHPQFEVDTASGMVELATPLPTEPQNLFLTPSEAEYLLAQQLQQETQYREARELNNFEVDQSQGVVDAEEQGESLERL